MIEKSLKFVLYAAFAVLLAPVAAPYLGELAAVVADRPDRAVPALGYRAEAVPEPRQTLPPSGRAVALKADGRGHFEADATINNRRIPVLVDTGATSVAIRAEDAGKLGLRPMPNDYTVPINTANGLARGARVVLDEIRIGQVRMRNVEAIVMPPKALNTNLLGMTFLKRLARVEMKEDRLLLTE